VAVSSAVAYSTDTVSVLVVDKATVKIASTAPLSPSTTLASSIDRLASTGLLSVAASASTVTVRATISATSVAVILTKPERVRACIEPAGDGIKPSVTTSDSCHDLWPDSL